MIRKLVASLLPFVVLALGVMVLIALVRSKPRAKKAPRDESGTAVEAMQAVPDDQAVTVSAYGTVVPSREVVIAPEVNGKVTWVNQELLPGGYFSEGDVLLRLDGRDYKLALDQQEATVDRARTELQVEESRKTIAEREWELMGKDSEGNPLALRDPQVKTARVAVAAAKSGLERARLNIGRTVVRAPFNAVVQRRAVDEGQIIGPTSPVVTLVGTDSFWVQISVPIDRLAWFDIPGLGGAAKGSEATIWRELGGERTGRVIRLMTDVDPLGRMARVLVEIDDPLGLKDRRTTVVGEEARPPKPSIPFLVGAFVQVDIHGRSVPDVLEIPRQALRDGDSVYVMKPERIPMSKELESFFWWASPGELEALRTVHRLEVRPVQVVWRQRDAVLIRGGIGAGERIVTSPVPAAIDGMKLRLGTADPGDKPASGGVAPKAAKASVDARGVAPERAQ